MNTKNRIIGRNSEGMNKKDWIEFQELLIKANKLNLESMMGSIRQEINKRHGMLPKFAEVEQWWR